MLAKIKEKLLLVTIYHPQQYPNTTGWEKDEWLAYYHGFLHETQDFNTSQIQLLIHRAKGLQADLVWNLDTSSFFKKPR